MGPGPRVLSTVDEISAAIVALRARAEPEWSQELADFLEHGKRIAERAIAEGQTDYTPGVTVVRLVRAINHERGR